MLKESFLMQKMLILLSFFLITPFFLILMLILLASSENRPAPALGFFPSPKNVTYAAIPINKGVLGASVDLTDRRVELVQNYLAEYNSPLLDDSGLIVEKADEYGIDYRLIPAIAMQESLLCKREVKGTHNCWGYGIYGKKKTSFDNYEEAIDTITRYFAKMKRNGVVSLEEIGKIYNPSNTNNWVGNVSLIMDHL